MVQGDNWKQRPLAQGRTRAPPKGTAPRREPGAHEPMRGAVLGAGWGVAWGVKRVLLAPRSRAGAELQGSGLAGI